MMRLVQYISLVLAWYFITARATIARAQSHLIPTFENPYRLNAAFPGSTRLHRLIANYNPGSSFDFSEVDLSYSTLFNPLSGTIGFMSTYFKDQKSRIEFLSVDAFYAYKLIIASKARDYICVSAGTAIGINYLKGQNFPPTYSPRLSPGIVIYNVKFYTGAGFNNIQLMNRFPENLLPESQNKAFNAFAGGWLPIDNWKRDPENFLSPNIEYSASAGRHEIAIGAYYAHNWIMPGLFYEYSDYRSSEIRLSAGLSKDFLRIHLVASAPVQNIGYKNLSFGISAFLLFHKYNRGEHWSRSLELHCPATW
jgi:hypothetical protein